MTLGGQDRVAGIVGCRTLLAPAHPGLQILDRIDDAPADLGIFRAGAVGAMLLKCAAGKTEKSSGFGGSEIARRKACVGIGLVPLAIWSGVKCIQTGTVPCMRSAGDICRDISIDPWGFWRTLLVNETISLGSAFWLIYDGRE